MLKGWFSRGDIDGFFGLFVDNLLQLMLIAVFCNRFCGMPAAWCTAQIFPAPLFPSCSATFSMRGEPENWQCARAARTLPPCPTDHGWLNAMVNMFKPFFHGEVRLFKLAELPAAKDWITKAREGA